jgi:hypothetical protein
MVDLPDSPAPVRRLELGGKGATVWVLTEKQHLDLVALHHLVALELVLNLLVPLLPLLLLCAHSATHGGWWVMATGTCAIRWSGSAAASRGRPMRKSGGRSVRGSRGAERRQRQRRRQVCEAGAGARRARGRRSGQWRLTYYYKEVAAGGTRGRRDGGQAVGGC